MTVTSSTATVAVAAEAPAIEVVKSALPGPGLGFALAVSLGVAILTALALRLARRLFPGSGRGARLRPLFEAAVWAALAAYTMSWWIRVDPVWGGVLVGLVTLAAVPVLWTLGADLVAATWSNLSAGDEIELDGRLARVARLGSRWVDVDTEDGWRARVPYRKLAERLERKRRRAELMRLILDVPRDADLLQARAKAIELALCSPWCRVQPAPTAEVTESGIELEAHGVSASALSALRADVWMAWAKWSEDATPPAPRPSSVRSESSGSSG